MEKKKKVDVGMLVAWLVVGLVYQFILGHISALVGELGYIGAVMEFINHILNKPLDMLHYDFYVYILGWSLFLGFFLASITKPKRPKPEMEGIEHGSSRFQTEEDIKIFLKKFSTPILPYEPPVIVDEVELEEDDEG